MTDTQGHGRLRKVWAWIPWVLVAALPVVVGGVQLWTSDTFRAAFYPALIATLLGIIVGAPVGLWIDRRHTQEERTRTEDEAERRGLERKRSVLQHIGAELGENWDSLSTRMSAAQRTPGLPFLTADKWNALGQADELRWLADDPDLLSTLVDAYFWIGVERSLEERWFDVIHRSGARFPGQPDPNVQFASYLLKFDQDTDRQLNKARAEVGIAIDRIEEQLKIGPHTPA